MKLSILISFTCLIVVTFAQNECFGFVSPDVQPGTFFTWGYGIQDSNDGVSTPYNSSVYSSWWSSQYDNFAYQENGFLGNFFTYFINSVPFAGGKNASNYDLPSVPTASFVCDTPFSGTWGPLYPNFYEDDTRKRGSHFDLKATLQYSAPNQTSYIRNIVTIKNIGTSLQTVSLVGDWVADSAYGADVSPESNEGRYYTAWPFQEDDPGTNNDFPYLTYNSYWCQTVHARGPKSRVSNALIHVDMKNLLVGPTYYTELAAGEEMSLMYIVSTGTNVTVALKNAAEIDTEPAHIFHDLNADQLSLIRNWGACEVIITPTVTVTVNAPSQCSSGLTSDFTVTATSTRADVKAAGLTHRVILPSGDELVAAQSSTTLTVPNDVGQVTHQLWYKQCLVKETSFTACATAPPIPTSSPVAAPTATGKVSSSSSLSVHAALVSVVLLFVSSVSHMRSTRTTTMIVVLCLVGLVFNNGVAAQESTCTNIAVNELDVSPITWRFGRNDGGGSPLFSTLLASGWWSPYDLYAYAKNTMWDDNFFNFWINSVPLTGAKNFTQGQSSHTPTANFTCDTNYSGMWGPAYPDYRGGDAQVRGRFQNLKAYVHYSAPEATSYVRAVLFVKNIGSTSQRVRVSADWLVDYFGNDFAPANEGRYFVPFPWQSGDMGRNGDDPASTFSARVHSIHFRGPNARDKDVVLVRDFSKFVISPAYFTTLAAGKEMALMFIISFATNTSMALRNGANIDSEPANIFHNLKADQLSLIRNWGACQSVIGPNVTVTVNAPSQCSSGVTSDFTVTATSTRTDLTDGFKHRVVSSLRKTEIVPAQTSITLAVRNGAGPLVHQLWYKECLVKETGFNACP